MTIIAKSVYTGGQWKPVLGSWVYQNGWKRVNKYSTYSSTGSPAGWKSSPLEIPAAPVLQSDVNSAGVTPNTFKYTAGGGESNILRSGEFIIFGNVRLEMQPNGDLVGYKRAYNSTVDTRVFSTNTISPSVDGSYYFEAASDGNYYIRNAAGTNIGASTAGTGGRIWPAGGLKPYLEAGGSGTLTMSGGKITIQPDMHIVWYPSSGVGGVGIGTWAADNDYGIPKYSSNHPFLPYYPADASPPSVGDTTFKLYTYSSTTATKGTTATVQTGEWGTALRSTAPIDTNKRFMTYEIATISPAGIEGPTTTFKWKLGSAEVPAVARVEGWGASTTLWAENNFTASLGPGTQLCIVPSGTFSATVDSILNFNTAGYNYSGVFRPYQEGDTGLQPRNGYGVARWIGGTQWSGYGAGTMAAPSVNIHAKTRRRVTSLALHYNEGHNTVVSQSGYTTDVADGFTIYQLWTPGVTVGGGNESNDGIVKWNGLNIDTASASAIGFQCIRAAFFIGGNLTTSPGYGLNARCEIYGIIETSEPWEVKVAGSAGIAATAGSQW